MSHLFLTSRFRSDIMLATSMLPSPNPLPLSATRRYVVVISPLAHAVLEAQIRTRHTSLRDALWDSVARSVPYRFSTMYIRVHVHCRQVDRRAKSSQITFLIDCNEEK